MKRKIINLFLIPTIVLPVTACAVTSCSIVDRLIQRAKQVDGSDWIGRISGLFVQEDDYEVNEEDKSVTYWNMSELVSRNLVVPNYVMWKGEQYKVLLDFNAFENCNNTLSGTVEMNDFFTDITSYCFRNCTEITKLILHNYPQTVGEFAFQYCNSLNEIVVKSGNFIDTNWAIGLKNVQSKAFDSCAIKGKIMFGPELEYIGTEAFAGCFELTEVDMSMCKKLRISAEGVAIEDGAFINSGITRVFLPAWKQGDETGDVLFIGAGAFSECDSLVTISLANPENERLNLSNNALAHCKSFIGFTNANGAPIIDDDNFKLFGVGRGCFKGDKSLRADNYLMDIGTPDFSTDALLNATFSGCSFSSWTFTPTMYASGLEGYAFAYNNNLKSLDFTSFEVGAGIPDQWQLDKPDDPVQNSENIFAFGSTYGVIKVRSGFVSGGSFSAWRRWFELQGLSFNENPTVQSPNKWFFQEVQI